MGDLFQPKRLQALRKFALGLTQEQMAERLECSIDTVKAWENRGSEPGGRFVDKLYKMCSEKGLDFEKISIFGKNE